MPNNVCIITGAGRGIGRTTAIELDRLGWRLVLVSRSNDELKATAALVGKLLPLSPMSPSPAMFRASSTQPSSNTAGSTRP